MPIIFLRKGAQAASTKTSLGTLVFGLDLALKQGIRNLFQVMELVKRFVVVIVDGGGWSTVNLVF